MIETLTYRGYTGSIERDVEDGGYFGTVRGIRGVIHYESQRREGLEREFQASVDCYLEWCEERGKEPERPRSVENTPARSVA